MRFDRATPPWGVAAVAASLGALLWALSPAISGHPEPWDADSAYYLMALPVAGFVSGLIAGGPLWAQYTGVVLGQVLYGLIFIALGPLMLLGLAFLVPYGLLFVLGNMVGIKVRQARATQEREPRRALTLVGTPPGGATLDRYDGQSVQELIDLQATYRIDSLLNIIEGALVAQGILRSLSQDERYVLAIRAFEREVREGGYVRFVQRTPEELIHLTVRALYAIGCDKAAVLTAEALAVAGIEHISDGGYAQAVEDPIIRRKLLECDVILASNDEDIAESLFRWVEHNTSRVSLHLDE